MYCPYCEEAVNYGATVCKTCQRDIALALSLKKANLALEERVHELEAELALLRERGPTLPAVEEAPAGLRSEGSRPEGLRFIDLAALFLLVPTVLLMGAHYLLVIRFDINLVWLRAVSIALPAVFGLILERKLHPRWYVTLAYGVVVACVSVLGMSTVVHYTDGDAILPHNQVAWRETLEYVTSIALSYLLGASLARVAQPMKLTGGRSYGRPSKLATLLATHVTGRKGEPLQQRIQRMVKLIQLGVSAATAIGAVYTGFKSIL